VAGAVRTGDVGTHGVQARVSAPPTPAPSTEPSGAGTAERLPPSGGSLPYTDRPG
jgi:hypothetical protein